MAVYGYMIQARNPSPSRQRSFLKGCELVFFDQSRQFAVPFMARPEASLLMFKLRARDVVLIYEIHLLGKDLGTLTTFCKNRKVVFIDRHGHTLNDMPDPQEFLASYYTECERLKIPGASWQQIGTPLGWQANDGRLVRNSKQRAWSEMLMCLADEHGFTSKDFERHWHLPIRSCIAAARAGFPINSEWSWEGASGMEDRFCRRRNTYMMILGVLNGRECTVQEIYAALEGKGAYVTYVKRRVYELVRMGAVKRRLRSDGPPSYLRNWDWHGDANPFSVLALCRAIYKEPRTAGSLSQELMTPRWVIVEAIGAVEKSVNRKAIEVTFDRSHRAMYRLLLDPEHLNYHKIKQTARFAWPERRTSERIARLRALVASDAPPRTVGNARPSRGRSSSPSCTSPPRGRRQAPPVEVEPHGPDA